MASTQEVISSFICPRDPDIESFLKTKAIKFEKASKIGGCICKNKLY